jgi:integrase
MTSYEVRFWEIRHRRDRRQPYQVRWTVAGRAHAESFVTKALAQSYRSKLMQAARAGEPFDEITGLPESEARSVSWFDHACDYIDMKWPRAAAKSRKAVAEAMTTATMALLGDKRNRPDDEMLRRALYGWAFNAPERAAGEPPREIVGAITWIRRASLPVSALRDLTLVRRILDALALKLDGKPAAATTIARKRAVVYNALGYAVERNLLPANPIDRVQWTAPEVAEAVDRRVVARPDQAADLLAAVAEIGRRGDHLVAFFGCLYYAGMRPAETIALRLANCVLPSDGGWGRLLLTGSEPRAGVRWTDDGGAREARQLKRRASATVRQVPIPPVLVRLLRGHLDRYGAGLDGRLFRTESGGPLHEGHYRSVWAKARELALDEVQVASPLARRPYDLRHGAASLWLNAGVPVTEVARRLGHSVAVLLKVYANCVDGEEQVMNGRIESALGADGSDGTLGTAADQSRTGDEESDHGPDETAA